MALHTKAGNQIPEDAVKLSEEDALTFQRNLISSWKYSSDVFYLKAGSGILAASAAFSGFYINNYYRNKVHLRHLGRIATFFPAVVLPSVASLILHNQKIVNSILLEKYDCPICLEIKSVSMQVLASVAYPLILAPTSSFLMALHYNTYNVPFIGQDPRSAFKLFKRFTVPMYSTFIGITALQAIVAAFVTYKENQNLYTVKNKLLELEYKIENSQ